MVHLVADFETNNNKEDCRVWGFGCANIHNLDEYVDGTSIDDFMYHIFNYPSKEVLVYFHNLKFDGEFILIWLLSNGYELTYIRPKEPNTFNTLISDMGVWYAIEIKLKTKTIKIWDSYKVLPFSVDDIAKSFKLPEQKLSIDYDMHREEGHKLTQEEKEYIRHDVIIMGKALYFMLGEGEVKMTAGSNALEYFKHLYTEKNWKYYFPKLPDHADEYIRKSYRGGWTYANPKYQNKDIGEGVVLDVNSLYPSRMYNELLPYGEPIPFSGKYGGNQKLYVQRIDVCFHLKEGYLPTIQIKDQKGFNANEFLVDSHGDVVRLTLTNYDLELLLTHYEIDYIEYIDGMAFHSYRGLFDEYIDHWMQVKVESEKTGNKPMRTLAKLKMNSLYGKFAKRPHGQPKWPELVNSQLHLYLGEDEEQESLYIPMGVFIVATARYYTITSAQSVFDRFLYADTDSLHLLGTDLPTNLKIDKYELGAWKHESTFRRARYIGAKCYLEDVEAEKEELDSYLALYPDRSHHCDYTTGHLLKITCAGLPDKNKSDITYENFKEGLVIKGKLRPVHVKGGIVLEKTTFEIKNRKNRKIY